MSDKGFAEDLIKAVRQAVPTAWVGEGKKAEWLTPETVKVTAVGAKGDVREYVIDMAMLADITGLLSQQHAGAKALLENDGRAVKIERKDGTEYGLAMVTTSVSPANLSFSTVTVARWRGDMQRAVELMAEGNIFESIQIVVDSQGLGAEPVAPFEVIFLNGWPVMVIDDPKALGNIGDMADWTAIVHAALRMEAKQALGDIFGDKAEPFGFSKN